LEFTREDCNDVNMINQLDAPFETPECKQDLVNTDF